jgi:hypothetical protein
MTEQNRLAALAGVAPPAAAPMPSLNILSRLLLEGPRPPEQSLPPTPYYTEARSAQPTRPTFRDIVAQTLDPDSRGNRIAMGFTGPAQVNARNVQQGIRAFHGSPHRFDRFDMSRIGTGEGAQAYGHGLYFAENEGVARSYRATLSGDPTIDGRALNWANPSEHAAAMVYSEGGRDGAIRALTNEVEYLRGTRGFNEANNDAARALRFLQEGGTPPPVSTPGSMYEVNLRADPSRLLDWDAPLGQQPQEVRDGISEILRWQRPAREALEAHRGTYGDPLGRHVYSAIEGLVPRTDGRAFAGNPSAGAFAAGELRDAGIPGIRYLDGGSRAAGDGTRNYVMFDDNLIDIVRRYGLAGLLMGGGAAAVGGASDQ